MKPGVLKSRPLAGYATAVGAWALAFALRYLLDHAFPPGFPYLTFFPAVVAVTYVAGWRAGLLTAVLSGLTAWWFFIGPPGFELNGQTAVALGFYLFVVAVDVFFIDGMNRAQAEAERETERARALAEARDLLSQEMQHRISNNIQMVAALLSLQARASDGETRRALKEASSRTALIGRIQRGLAAPGGASLSFGDHASGLIADTLGAAGRKDVTVAVTGDVAAPLSSDEINPVSLIMLECVSNALEHAFPTRPGDIHVRLERGEETRLTIQDDGDGLPNGFDPATSRSLGLQIVQGLAASLGGRFEMSGGAGTTCVLTYPPRRVEGV